VRKPRSSKTELAEELADLSERFGNLAHEAIVLPRAVGKALDGLHGHPNACVDALRSFGEALERAHGALQLRPYGLDFELMALFPNGSLFVSVPRLFRELNFG